MAHVYVLHQPFVSLSTAMQRVFAESAAAKLRALHGIWPEPTSQGLSVLARSETELDAAVVLLNGLYSDMILPGPRQVCRRRNPAMEAVMDVFVWTPTIHARVVIDDLDRRNAIRISTSIETTVGSSGRRRRWRPYSDMAARLPCSRRKRRNIGSGSTAGSQ